MRESGFPQLETAGWQGLLGPPCMSQDVVGRLAGELNRVLARPDIQKKFIEAGTPVTQRSAEQFAEFVRVENQRWLPVITASGAKIDRVDWPMARHGPAALGVPIGWDDCASRWQIFTVRRPAY